MARAKTNPITKLSDLDKGGHGGFTLALAPPFFGGIGFLVDNAVGWTPVLTILGALYGLGGGVYKVVGDYRAKMATQDRTPGWAAPMAPSEQTSPPDRAAEAELSA